MVRQSEPRGSVRGLAQRDHDRQLDYVEFGTTDVEATKAFYRAVFGWTFTDYGPGYTSFADGRLTGGFSRERPITSGSPLVVIYAADLLAAQQQVVAHGGAITIEPFEFPGGRRFHFTDPSGNELAVWSET